MGLLQQQARRAASYLDEFVYGANDGIITTFAVVSGAAGAGLSHTAVIILGVANLVADGFSMGASSFLSIRTQRDVDHARGRRVTRDEQRALSRSMTTFVGFCAAGCLPLLPFITVVAPGREFLISSIASGFAFFVVGASRSFVTKRSLFVSGAEMVAIGGTAAVLAYLVGYLVERIVA